jgi:hypothetical protein
MQLAVRVTGMPEPDLPQGYAITIVLGELVLHGLRFASPASEVDVTMDLGMPQPWPSRGPVHWPAGGGPGAVESACKAANRRPRSRC